MTPPPTVEVVGTLSKGRRNLVTGQFTCYQVDDLLIVKSHPSFPAARGRLIVRRGSVDPPIFEQHRDILQAAKAKNLSHETRHQLEVLVAQAKEATRVATCFSAFSKRTEPRPLSKGSSANQEKPFFVSPFGLVALANRRIQDLNRLSTAEYGLDVHRIKHQIHVCGVMTWARIEMHEALQTLMAGDLSEDNVLKIQGRMLRIESWLDRASPVESLNEGAIHLRREYGAAHASAMDPGAAQFRYHLQRLIAITDAMSNDVSF